MEVYFGFKISLHVRLNYIPIVCLGAKNKNKETEWHPRTTLTQIKETVMELLRQFLHKELFWAPLIAWCHNCPSKS